MGEIPIVGSQESRKAEVKQDETKKKQILLNAFDM
jgi:hypothetical protein